MITSLSTESKGFNSVYIYGFGIAGKWLSQNLNTKVDGFIDTDSKKNGLSFNGIRVLSTDQAKEVLDKDSLIIISVIDIQDVLSIIETLPHKKSLAAGTFFNEIKTTPNPNFIESKDFIDYSLHAVEKCHKGYFSDKELFLRSIDIVITEKCSLKCKDCSNLMQYYESPVDISFDEIINDFNVLTKNVGHVFEVRLIGGEPFMNKDIYKIISYLVQSEKISRLVVFSNAMVKIKEEYYDLLKNKKIVFSLTNYGALAKNTPIIVEQLTKFNVPYRLHPPENWTDSGVIFDFKRTQQGLEEIFNDCCGKNLLTVTNGRLYRCPFAANADRLMAIPFKESNFVSVDATTMEIEHYTRNIKSLPACNYCKGRSFNSPSITPAIQTKNPIPYIKLQEVR
jgi:MoaA/NifB/PqqE/SkfB family radical SAM enzyme